MINTQNKILRVYTGGTFDIPHLGHYNFFRQCKELFPDSYLIVSLNTDEFIKRYKGVSPIFSYSEREKYLNYINLIDKVVRNAGDEDSKPTILACKSDIILIGNDWLEKDYCKQMGFDAKWLREHRISLCYLPYTEGISTSDIKKRLLNV